MYQVYTVFALHISHLICLGTFEYSKTYPEQITQQNYVDFNRPLYVTALNYSMSRTLGTRWILENNASATRQSVSTVDTQAGEQRPTRGNWNITPHPVVGGEGPGEGITAPPFLGSEQGNCYLNVKLGFLPLTFIPFNVLSVTK